MKVIKHWYFLSGEGLSPGQRCQLGVELTKFVRSDSAARLEAHRAYSLVGDLYSSTGRKIKKGYISAPIDFYEGVEGKNYEKLFPYHIGRIVVAHDCEGEEYLLAIAGRK